MVDKKCNTKAICFERCCFLIKIYSVVRKKTMHIDMYLSYQNWFYGKRQEANQYLTMVMNCVPQLSSLPPVNSQIGLELALR